jgi:two-component system response regulator NreC
MEETDPFSREVSTISREPAARIRIVVVEDHAILREGLVALLEIEEGLEIVGVASEVASAVELVGRLRPTVMMTDLTLPGDSGIVLLAAARAVAPDTRSLVLTAHHDEEYFRAAIEAGALGYVFKDAGRVELLQAIKFVAEGKVYLSGGLTERLLSGYLQLASGDQAPAPASLLTPREREILKKIATGRSNKATARTLGLSVKTVEKHRANLMHKLGLHNSAEVTMFAIKHGLVSGELVDPAT